MLLWQRRAINSFPNPATELGLPRPSLRPQFQSTRGQHNPQRQQQPQTGHAGTGAVFPSTQVAPVPSRPAIFIDSALSQEKNSVPLTSRRSLGGGSRSLTRRLFSAPANPGCRLKLKLHARVLFALTPNRPNSRRGSRRFRLLLRCSVEGRLLDSRPKETRHPILPPNLPSEGEVCAPSQEVDWVWLVNFTV